MAVTCRLSECGASDVCGSMMYTMATQYYGSDSLDQALHKLWDEASNFYRNHGRLLKVPKFTRKTISISDNLDYPRLETRMKAAKCKMMIWRCALVPEIGPAGI